MARVLLLTGTRGSGKTTVSTLLEQRGCRRICEDDIRSDNSDETADKTAERLVADRAEA